MLTIRFSRIGKRKNPFFRIIVSDKRKDTHARYLELLGNYNPRTKEVTLKSDRIKYWMSVGASTSASVNNLLIKEKIIEGKKEKSVFISKERAEKIAKEKAEAAPKPEAPAAVDSADAPVQSEPSA